jgi:hypothetical protein
MFWSDGRKLAWSILLGTLAVPLWVTAYAVQDRQMVTLLLTTGLAFVFSVGAFFLGLAWILGVWVGFWREARFAQSTTPMLRILEAARGLTPEQAAVVPQLSFGAQVDIVVGDDGPRYHLWTPGGHVPWEFLEGFLRRCSMTYLEPINRYMDETPGRLYARLFTDWCVMKGFASPATGPHPAAWMDAQSRSKAAKLLGIDLGIGN